MHWHFPLINTKIAITNPQPLFMQAILIKLCGAHTLKVEGVLGKNVLNRGGKLIKRVMWESDKIHYIQI